MENQEILKAIASLADKTGRYHERLMVTERELATHLKNCNCHSPEPKKAYEEECEACSA